MGNIPRFVCLYLNVLPFKPMFRDYISLQKKKKRIKKYKHLKTQVLEKQCLMLLEKTSI